MYDKENYTISVKKNDKQHIFKLIQYNQKRTGSPENISKALIIRMFLLLECPT